MGKKKSKKLRKILQAQAAIQQQPHGGQSPAGTVPEIPTPATSNQPVPAEPAPTVEEGEVKEVRSEIRKILITVLVLVLLIVAIYLANLKTDFILRLGAWLSRVLNINV
jgi:hypothetical protein